MRKQGKEKRSRDVNEKDSKEDKSKMQGTEK